MKKLQFKTNSRHISQLGRELVTDFVTALVELIKNSYDADAYGVKVILDKPNTPQSRIILIDTGTGMTQSEFENKWMVIGTNNKVTEPYTPNGRKKAGKKGIGRFSVERLAEKVRIFSFPEFESPYRVDINWNSYEEINIPALTQRIGILKDHQESSAAKFICNQLDYFMVTDKIFQEDKAIVESIFGTRNFEYPMFYSSDALRLLEDKVVPIIKKYENIELLIGDVSSSLDTIDLQKESEIFNMLVELYNKYNLSEPQTGMVFIMEGLRDEWRQRDIDKLQKELRLLVAPDFIESDPFKIELVAPAFKVEDMVLVNEILDLRYAKIDAEIFDNAQKSRITYIDKGGKTDTAEENYETPLLCGNLKVEIYFFLRDSGNLSDAESGYNFRFAQRILDTYCGIKIYRDNFRVKPYGDIGNDWLLLDQKKVKDTHGYLVGNNQVIGVVKIGDESNPLLIDATNREGIIENEAYAQLVTFLTKCTNLISEVRRRAYLAEQEEIQKLADEKRKIDSQFENLKDLYKEDDFVKQIGKLSSNVGDVSVKAIDSLLKTYIEHTEKKKQGIEKIQYDYNRHYSQTQKAYQSKIEFQESELNLYKNLASLGMLTGSFGHETSDIVSRIQTSLLLVNLYLDNGNIDQIKDVISIVSGDFDRIYAYSNLIVNFLRKRKRTLSAEINLSSVLKEIGSFYQTIVKSFNITLQFVCEDKIEYKIRQIDFESIVINMITNAFEQVKGRENRKIFVTISQSPSHLMIYFEDSGAGVPEGKEKEIFRPFETTKENGIGLGLNIVMDIVEKYHGEISVTRSETLLGAKFIVTLPKGDEQDGRIDWPIY
ncbi:sensor histidine kinase [Acutalibacter sp. 1XD8-36]|uniref:sensor histidine kinase n=1 Tax=Acutalibacter sp. 1XD8-36 TaxID=2320852 RepID=UPI00141345C5|nr:GHKL domain-containing protein [Acutalibacter sp. 1XD8-36]